MAELVDARDLKSEMEGLAIFFKISKFSYLSIIYGLVSVPISSDKFPRVPHVCSQIIHAGEIQKKLKFSDKELNLTKEEVNRRRDIELDLSLRYNPLRPSLL